MGVVRRRHLLTRRGRELIGLDDEVFDRAAIEAAGLEVSGEGALLAALERNRTGRMHDIVATIQSEQDEAIRADVHGVLVVGGGPAPERPLWRCTAPRTFSTRTVSASRRRACCSSARARCSCATSSRCCRRSANRTCS